MDTDSALRELVRRFRDNQRFHESEMFRSEDKVVIEARKASADAWQMAASRLESILTAAGEAQPKPVRHSCETDMLSECPGCNADVAKPAPAGMVLVPRKVTEAMNDAYNNVPSGFAGSPPASQWVWDAMLAAAPTAPQPTLDEAFDQVKAAMMREVRGEGAQAVAWQVRRADLPERGWEACTQELYEVTLHTGRYAGYDNGPPCEVRALYTAPPSLGGEDAARLQFLIANEFVVHRLRDTGRFVLMTRNGHLVTDEAFSTPAAAIDAARAAEGGERG